MQEAATTMDSNPTTTPPSVRDQEVNRFNEVAKVFYNFIGFLFAIIALINTDGGKSLFMAHHTVMLALVSAVVLFFLTLVLGTMLQLHLRNFLPLIMAMLLLGSVVSVLFLVMIWLTAALIALALRLLTFALIGYCSHPELCENMVAKVMNLIASDTVNPQNPQSPKEAESDDTHSPCSPPV